MTKSKYIKYSALLALVVIVCNCKKDDPKTITEIVLPKCEISISGGQAEFEYGDTISIFAHATENSEYVIRMELYLDNKLLVSKKVKEFSYDLPTTTLLEGEHNFKLIAIDLKDSTGIDLDTINITATLPKVFTMDVDRIGTDSAMVMGELLSSGGKPVTWGVCYNTTGTPSKDDLILEATDSAFNISISGLTKLTTYFVRSWATNDLGTNYGEIVEFKTIDESGTFSDFRDDHVYRWVKIGEQVWMAENLAYLPFLSDPHNNPINDSAIWVYGYSGMDIEEAKQTENYNEYGVLYSFRMASKYCPTGWHLPDTNEWNELIEFLGGAEVAGGKMKEKGTKHWKSPNTGATNESGFSAIGGGDFLPYTGLGNYLNERSYYWYSIDSNPEEGYLDAKYILSYKLNLIALQGSYISKKIGHSVRCVKD